MAKKNPYFAIILDFTSKTEVIFEMKKDFELDVIVLSRTQLTSPTLFTIFHSQTDTHAERQTYSY